MTFKTLLEYPLLHMQISSFLKIEKREIDFPSCCFLEADQ